MNNSEADLTGEVQRSGAVRCTFIPGAHLGKYHAVNSAWCKGVTLLPVTGKTRMALVWVDNYGMSKYFKDVFVKVRVSSDLSDEDATNKAQFKAYRLGKGYSWSMWARQQIKAWMPIQSEKGREHIAKTLKLHGFEDTAADVLLFHH